MTSEILDLIKQRDQAYYNFKKKSGSAEEYKMYKLFRNQIQRDIKTASYAETMVAESVSAKIFKIGSVVFEL